MRVGDVELPAELVSAHSAGRLVIFVGAGASVAAPSCLPTFDCLAARIGNESRQPYPGDSSGPDQFLECLKARGVDVHLRVHEIIGCRESEPNPLHRAIAALALSSAKPRVVTTNYDRHLSECLPGTWEFHPPALPAADFAGIVYLHGSVAQQPADLVVTKADFGRAYLVEGWANHFLQLMLNHPGFSGGSYP